MVIKTKGKARLFILTPHIHESDKKIIHKKKDKMIRKKGDEQTYIFQEDVKINTVYLL